MSERICDLITLAARRAMPDILASQIVAAEDGDTKAANFVATVGKFIRTGVSVNTSQNNIAAEPDDKWSDEEIDNRIGRFMAKVGEHTEDGEAA